MMNGDGDDGGDDDGVVINSLFLGVSYRSIKVLEFFGFKCIKVLLKAKHVKFLCK